MEFRKMVTITLYVRQQKRHRCIEQSFGPGTQPGGLLDLEEGSLGKPQHAEASRFSHRNRAALGKPISGQGLSGLPRRESQPWTSGDIGPGRCHLAGGFGGLRAAPGHFRVHVLFGGFSPPPSCLRKLLCLGRDPRVEERSPHSASEHSGSFNFCSAQVLRTGGLDFSGTGLRVLIRKERGRGRLVTAPSNVRRARQEIRHAKQGQCAAEVRWPRSV